jgi:hypothetical protein
MLITSMKFTFLLSIACITLAFIVTGCDNRGSASSQRIAVSSPVVTSTALPDKWLGKWSGPEGTFLLLAGGDGKYEVTIQDLDGPRTFQGIDTGNLIEFERNGMKESLKATNGAETGMKWLSGKSNCLTIRAGEGYCRD